MNVLFWLTIKFLALVAFAFGLSGAITMAMRAAHVIEVASR